MNSVWQPRKPAIAVGRRCVNLKFLRPSFTCLCWCSRKKVLSLSCISALLLKCSPSLVWESGVSSLIPANQEPFQSFLSLDNPHCLGGCQSHSILVLKRVRSACVLQSYLCLQSFRKGWLEPVNIGLNFLSSMTRDGRLLGYRKGSREMHMRTKLRCPYSPFRV